MYAVKNSVRALFAAVIPLAAIHAVLFAMVLLGTQSKPALLALPTPDHVLVLYFVQLATDTSLLFAGHIVLRQRAISGRLAYALMGGTMAALSYLIVLHNGFALLLPGAGHAVTEGLLPTFAGMMAGFLYCQFAGLAPARVSPRFSTEGLMASYRFDGPVRVRTSVAATLVVATIPAVLSGILTFEFVWNLVPRNLLPASDSSASIFFAAIPAQMFLIALTATVVPSGIFILCVHHAARALRCSRGWEYALLGGLMAFLCGIVVAPFTALTAPVPFMLLPAFGCGAIMGALYRRFAGLEPVPLPEPVIVTDVNTLVPADHSSRQGHSVVFTD